MARDFILPEFVKNPAEATYASIGLDLVAMFPMARVFKGGKAAIDYLRTIDRMGIDDINQELTRLNKARAVNKKNIFAKNNSAEQIKKLEADELELSNAIVKKLGDRREQLTRLDTAEKIMGTAGDGSKIIPRFSFGGGVGGFFTSLYNKMHVVMKIECLNDAMADIKKELNKQMNICYPKSSSELNLLLLALQDNLT